MGGLRSSAQLISYELPLGLGILGVVLAAGSLRLETIVAQQAVAGVWNVALQPLGFLVFCVAGFAEAGRLPFDLPEAEQELVGGYHTEYSGIKLLLYLVAEFLHMVTASFLIVILFLGGWHFWGLTDGVNGPGGDQVTWVVAVLRIIVLLVKVMAVILFFMLARWSWPRFRFDQLMDLGWKLMLPWGMVNLVVVAVCVEYGDSLAARVGLSTDGRHGRGRRDRARARLVGGHADRPYGRRQPPAARGHHAQFRVRQRGGPVAMKPDDPHIHWTERPQLGMTGKSYLLLFIQGLTTTIRHLFGRKMTIQSPEQRHLIPDPLIYRGVHRLNRDEQGRVKCVACFLCATACPAHCIDILAAESPWPDREKYPQSFTIDELRCIYCGMCEEACPVDAIELTSLYDLSGKSREEMLFDKEKLLSVYDRTKDAEPMRTQGSGFSGEGSGFSREGSGFRVQGSGLE